MEEKTYNEIKILAESIVKDNRKINDLVLKVKQDDKKEIQKLCNSEEYKNVIKIKQYTENVDAWIKEIDKSAACCSDEVDNLMDRVRPSEKDFISEYLRMKLVKKHNLRTENVENVIKNLLNKLK